MLSVGEMKGSDGFRQVVLVVASDPTTRATLDALLAEDGYDTLTECDGAAALDLLDGMSPCPETIACVILVDTRTAIVEGYEFAAALRHRPATATVPLICLPTGSPRAAFASVQGILRVPSRPVASERRRH